MPELLRAPSAVDVPAFVEAMVAAFADDPLYRWLHPDPAARAEAMRATFALVLAAGLARGRVDADPARTAVAVWTPPGVELLDDAGREGFLAILRTHAAPRVADALAGMAALGAHRPAAPHWALHNVAVAPAAQGAGAGTRLLRAGLDRADADGVAAHLDSSSARNVPFYERLGFAVVAGVPLSGGGPVMRAMVRPARAV
jgi:GNAT superfamily N-acetyltransferase